MTLNGVMAVILDYFTELMYDVVVQQLHRFQNLLLIVYDHIKTICAIIQRLYGQNKLRTRFDGCRCIDDYVHRLGLVQVFIVETVCSMDVGTGLYMYDVIVEKVHVRYLIS